MAKLHEVLAVEQGLQTTAKKTNEETIRTFGKKDEHFVESVRRVEYFDTNEAEKLNTTDTKAMVTTVFDKLLYNAGPNARAMDALLQKEATNQQASADIEVDDKVLVAGVPATVLLSLETKLQELRAVYEAVPTLAPGAVWEADRDARANGGVFKARDADVTFRTKKTIKPVVLHEATKEHPAQVQAIPEDVPVARISVTHKSGMVTSAQKSELLARIDRLLRAVKRARQRANAAEVVKRHMGKALMDFIHEGIVA